MTDNENTERTPSNKVFEEKNRERRGHDFIGPEILNAPEFYECEELPTEQQIVVAHYFNSNSDWWVIEVRQSDLMIFGYARINGWDDSSEYGYSSLEELESVVGPGGSVIERDLNWVPKPFSEIQVGE